MSIETETIAPPAADSTLSPSASNGSPHRGPELWRRRSNRVIAGLVALAIVGALIANSLIARQFTADGAVRQYLSALQSGDANSAWNAIQVSAPTQPVAASLTNQQAFQAALSSAKPDIRSFVISGDAQLDSSTTMVTFTYDTAAGSKQAKVGVQRSGQTHFGIYPSWHLIIAPTLLEMALPSGSNGITLDGKAIALPDGAKSTVAALPLAHKVQLNGTQMLAPQTTTIDSLFSLGQPVSFQAQLTPTGIDKAGAAVKAAFAACARQTSPNPDPGPCPQALSYSLSGTGKWNVVGDPTQDMAVSFDKDMKAAAVGHYQMIYGYQESSVQGVQHVPASGGYSASLALAPDAVTVASIQPASGLPALSRPIGASDQAAKALVAQAFKRCAAVRAQSVADCPQALISVASNVRWSLVGDPLSAATVDFDQNSGQLTVHGNFVMNVSYSFLGYPKTDRSFNTNYVAYLFWNGAGLQLVTIDGTNS